MSEQKTPNLKNLPAIKEKAKLPTLNELFNDKVQLVGKYEALNTILNAEPPVKWIKEHPSIPGWKYLPIEKVEYLLSKIFKRSKIKVLKTGMLLNAVEVTVRVKYVDPITGEWLSQDGVGACELQTQSKTGALKPDMSNINRGAVSMALPIAKSLAVKDATDHIGKIFGRDLNRKDVIPFTADQDLTDRYTKALENGAGNN